MSGNVDAVEADLAQTANIHLQMFGGESVVPVQIPPGEQPVSALLPSARDLAHTITAAAVAAAEREGRSVSCRAGCGACCRQLVVISLADAQALGELVARMPLERQMTIRQRFADAVHRLEAAGLLDANEPPGNRRLVQPSSGALPLAHRYFQQQVACPFLEDESCSIYADRPLICREYLVTSPAEDCSRLFELPIARVEVPVRMGGVMVQVTAKVAGAALEAIPLVLALEWSAAHHGELDRKIDGLALVRELVSEIANEHGRMASDP